MGQADREGRMNRVFVGITYARLHCNLQVGGGREQRGCKSLTTLLKAFDYQQLGFVLLHLEDDDENKHILNKNTGRKASVILSLLHTDSGILRQAPNCPWSLCSSSPALTALLPVLHVTEIST